MSLRLRTSWTWLLSAFFLSCASSPTNSSSIVLAGDWGGEHVTLTVNAISSHLEFDCAHGDIPGALTTDADQMFAVTGTFVRERGGPIRENESADVHPAMYIGRATAQTMRLTIRLTDSDTLIGTFMLTRGAPGRVVKCL
jgi:hypothetical protein